MRTATQVLMAAAAAMAAWAGQKQAEPSAPFEGHGVIVDINRFFTAASESGAPAELQAEHEIGGRALVTEEGVYAFLETPENAGALKETEPGSVVRVWGRLLERGALVHADSLQLATTVPLIDFAAFRNDPGEHVTLAGVNKCQCGLDVGDLPHSCKLGHLHHLETGDGRIYHYLQFGSGNDAFLGSGSHFRPVEVAGRLLPGQYLLVEELAVE